MSWIRYDDQFYGNPKVTAVIADDPAALSLHVLANTWSNGQKRPGFIPAHQPAVLILDRELAEVWAALLVKHDLWHDVQAMCDDCMGEYGDLAGGTGYVFHDHSKYRAPVRDRSTPGTPAALSEKRREAGRRGGSVSAANRTRFAGVSKAGQQAASAANAEANAQANAEANAGGTQANQPADSDFATALTTSRDTRQDSATGSATSQNGSTAHIGFAGVSKTSKPGEQGEIYSRDSVSPVPVPEPKELKDSLTRADIGTDKDPDFTAFWDAYPRAGSGNSKPGKGQARAAWRKAVITNGVEPKVIVAAAEQFRDFHVNACTDPRFIPHASTWLNGEGYNDEPAPIRRERNYDF